MKKLKFIALYTFLIAGEYAKEGEVVEFDPGTDKNFIKRLKDIGAIAECEESEDTESTESKKQSVASKKKSNAKTDDKSAKEKTDDKHENG